MRPQTRSVIITGGWAGWNSGQGWVQRERRPATRILCTRPANVTGCLKRQAGILAGTLVRRRVQMLGRLLMVETLRVETLAARPTCLQRVQAPTPAAKLRPSKRWGWQPWRPAAACRCRRPPLSSCPALMLCWLTLVSGAGLLRRHCLVSPCYAQSASISARSAANCSVGWGRACLVYWLACLTLPSFACRGRAELEC